MHRLNILVVIVDYFKGQRVVEAISAIRSQEYEQRNISITVIDNSCCEHNYATLQSASHEAKIEQSASNLGYVAAVNRAVEPYADDVDIVLLLNPDIVMTDPRTLSAMVENFQDPACLVAGPAQVNDDGSRPSIARDYPSLSALIAKRTFLGRTSWGLRKVRGYLLDGFDYRQRQQVPWLQSSCVLVRGSFWREINGLDPRYFLFMADIVICQEAYRRGGHVVYDPSVDVQADGRRCSEGGVLSLLSNKALRMHVVDAFAYYFTRSHGLRVGLFVLCCATLAYGLFRSAPAPYLFDQSDKLLHMVAFGCLAICGRIVFERIRPLLFWGVLLFLAPTLEWLQEYVQPAREFSFGDVGANAVGVGMAWSLTKFKGVRAKWVKV